MAVEKGSFINDDMFLKEFIVKRAGLRRSMGSSSNDVTQFKKIIDLHPHCLGFLVLNHHKIIDPFPLRPSVIMTSFMDDGNFNKIVC